MKALLEFQLAGASTSTTLFLSTGPYANTYFAVARTFD